MKESQRKGYCSRHLSMRSKSSGTTPDVSQMSSPRVTHRAQSATASLGTELHGCQMSQRRNDPILSPMQSPHPITPRRNTLATLPRKRSSTVIEDTEAAQLLMSFGKFTVVPKIYNYLTT